MSTLAVNVKILFELGNRPTNDLNQSRYCLTTFLEQLVRQLATLYYGSELVSLSAADSPALRMRIGNHTPMVLHRTADSSGTRRHCEICCKRTVDMCKQCNCAVCFSDGVSTRSTRSGAGKNFTAKC